MNPPANPTRFYGAHAERIEYTKGTPSRPVIVISAGVHRKIYLEYSIARQLVDDVHDLCDQYEAELRQSPAKPPAPQLPPWSERRPFISKPLHYDESYETGAQIHARHGVMQSHNKPDEPGIAIMRNPAAAFTVIPVSDASRLAQQLTQVTNEALRRTR